MASTATGAASLHRPDAGLDYAEQHNPFIDKTRECALGASYGGFMANWILAIPTASSASSATSGMFTPNRPTGLRGVVFNEWEFKASHGILRQAGRREPLAASGPGDVGQKLQDAHVPWLIHSPAGLPPLRPEAIQLFDNLSTLKGPSKCDEAPQ